MRRRAGEPVCRFLRQRRFSRRWPRCRYAVGQVPLDPNQAMPSRNKRLHIFPPMRIGNLASTGYPCSNANTCGGQYVKNG